MVDLEKRKREMEKKKEYLQRLLDDIDKKAIFYVFDTAFKFGVFGKFKATDELTFQFPDDEKNPKFIFSITRRSAVPVAMPQQQLSLNQIADHLAFSLGGKKPTYLRGGKPS